MRPRQESAKRRMDTATSEGGEGNRQRRGIQTGVPREPDLSRQRLILRAPDKSLRSGVEPAPDAGRPTCCSGRRSQKRFTNQASCTSKPKHRKQPTIPETQEQQKEQQQQQQKEQQQQQKELQKQQQEEGFVHEDAWRISELLNDESLGQRI
ncbi:hypothetical protein EPH_0029490 [Eimeria praecox]|uniref:Uncharacterized protein n=1 Tax=Eimeria praecox TaxID=51316 RepID=U6G5I4_9EIME|nr:hypothetical protein EPH_0029490 [Eimeria praecox]